MIAAVIMAGGVGTRLYPASTRQRPKQFVRWPGSLTPAADSVENGEIELSPGAGPGTSLLQQTYRRLLPITTEERLFIATTSDLSDQVQDELSGLPPENLIVEPCRRNSAGACALATAIAARAAGPETVVAMIPSDALVLDEEKYRQTLLLAAETARDEKGIVVIGIRPDRPATSYGYIQPGEGLHAGVSRVHAFVEKPRKERAEELLTLGCLWNAGIYVWRADVAYQAFQDFLPQHARLFECGANPQELAAIFEQLPSVSVDVGITEKYGNTFCVAGDFPWDDLGSWDAFGRVLPADSSGNVSLGSVRLEDSHNCITIAGDGRIITIGVQDLVIVRFGDTVLVCPRDRAQDVGKIGAEEG